MADHQRLRENPSAARRDGGRAHSGCATAATFDPTARAAGPGRAAPLAGQNSSQEADRRALGCIRRRVPPHPRTVAFGGAGEDQDITAPAVKWRTSADSPAS